MAAKKKKPKYYLCATPTAKLICFQMEAISMWQVWKIEISKAWVRTAVNAQLTGTPFLWEAILTHRSKLPAATLLSHDLPGCSLLDYGAHVTQAGQSDSLW